MHNYGNNCISCSMDISQIFHCKAWPPNLILLQMSRVGPAHCVIPVCTSSSTGACAASSRFSPSLHSKVFSPFSISGLTDRSLSLTSPRCAPASRISMLSGGIIRGLFGPKEWIEVKNNMMQKFERKSSNKDLSLHARGARGK